MNSSDPKSSRKDTDLPTCFVLAPIGQKQSPQRRRTEGVMKVIAEALKGIYRPQIAHELPNPGSITSQVLQRVLHSDLVIADVTGENPNVMYELGVRHAANQPYIMIAESGTELPFDITDERTLFYEDDLKGRDEFRDQLRQLVHDPSTASDVNSPVHRADRDFKAASASAPHGQEGVLSLIIDKLNHLENAMNAIRSERASSWFHPPSGLSPGSIGSLLLETPKLPSSELDAGWSLLSESGDPDQEG